MKKAAIFASMISVLFSTGFDTPDGAPIRQGVHIEWYRTVAPGNDGEAIFVWSDTRYGMRNIFAHKICLLCTSPSPRDQRGSRMPSSA